MIPPILAVNFSELPLHIPEYVRQNLFVVLFGHEIGGIERLHESGISCRASRSTGVAVAKSRPSAYHIQMYALQPDRPPFVRITKYCTPRRVSKFYSCPVSLCEEGGIVALTPEPCPVHVARPFEDFAAIAAAYGLDERELADFNGGSVYPSRAIYLCPAHGKKLY